MSGLGYNGNQRDISSMNSRWQRNLNQDSRGIISITVTVVFILVISLIVLGFSQVSQRNGKLALDRELSTQALYAAEAGVNDVRNAIAGYIDNPSSNPTFAASAGLPFPEQDKCNGTVQHSYNKNEGRVDGSDDSVRYTCLLVSRPPNLEATNVSDRSLIWPLVAEGGASPNIEVTEIHWSRASGAPTNLDASNCPGVGEHISTTGASSWASRCPFGILRVDLIKNDPAVIQSAQDAAAATMTVYVYPYQGTPPTASTFNYTSGEANIYGPTSMVTQGKVGRATCTKEECTLTLTGLDFPKAYVRIKSLYQPASTVRMERQGTGTFKDAQILIDVTARAQDVVRRIQARAPLTGTTSKEASKFFSDYGIESTGSICKRYHTSPALGEQAVPTGYGCP